MSGVNPIVLGRDEGTRVSSPVGGAIVFKALADETNDSFTAFEAVNPSGDGPSLHVHAAHDEVILELVGPPLAESHPR